MARVEVFAPLQFVSSIGKASQPTYYTPVHSNLDAAQFDLKGVVQESQVVGPL